MTMNWMQTLGWMPTDAQLEQFEQFYRLLLQANQSLNLTRITHHEDFWEKHLWDSLSGVRPWLSEGSRAHWMSPLIELKAVRTVIDIGTGGGFPGIPVAIACPDWHVSLLDSTQKKIASLTELIQQMDLTTVSTLCDRAERCGQQPDHRGHYDLALIRAVAAAPVCAEYAVPLIRDQGMAVLYRGHWDLQEEKALEQALEILGGELCQVQELKTPISQGDRHCVYVKKIAPTPEHYPRRVGVPTKKPLA